MIAAMAKAGDTLFYPNTLKVQEVTKEEFENFLA